MILDDLLRQPRERRRLLLSTCIFLAVISFLGLLSSAVWTSQSTTFLFPDDPSPTPTHPALSEAAFDSTLLSSNFINGSPTPHFRGNRLPSPFDHLQIPLDRQPTARHEIHNLLDIGRVEYVRYLSVLCNIALSNFISS
jgi:hypothetical protein